MMHGVLKAIHVPNHALTRNKTIATGKGSAWGVSDIEAIG